MKATKLLSQLTCSSFIFILLFTSSCDEHRAMRNAIEGNWNIDQLEFVEEDSLITEFGQIIFNDCPSNSDCPGRLSSFSYGTNDFVYTVDAINNKLFLFTSSREFKIRFQNGFIIHTPEIESRLIIEGIMDIEDTYYLVKFYLNKN
ncbi:MAG: hypothetical protein ACNS60_11520 [Candidatus Cyclobacteriaceae bacterium M2_1C_046]